jgi:hypothetical protein
MAANILSTRLPQMGISVNLGPSNMPAIANPGLTGLDAQAANEGWVRAALAATDGGSVPEFNESPEFQANQAITYTYTIYPWADKTHELIQDGMIVFVSRWIDPKYRLTNMAPAWKLNIMQTEAFLQAKNSTAPDFTEFKRLLAKYGERVLEEYHVALRNGLKEAIGNDELHKFFTMATTPKFQLLTKYGVTQAWNLCGVVCSKGESTGPGSFLDHHSQTDMCYNVGVVSGLKARTSNVFGKVSVGTHVSLILTREDANSPLQWLPYHNMQREYPSRIYSSYTDAADRICDSYVLKMGIVSESVEMEPSITQTRVAMGLVSTNVEAAAGACSLIKILTLQVRCG